MCDPVIAPIAVGVATAGLGAMQSIAGYQQKQAEYQYQVQAAQYKNQVAQANAVANYNRQMAAYHESQKSYEAQIAANEAAANRAYVYEQLKLQRDIKQASVDAQDRMVKKLEAQGDIWSMGRTGNSWKVLASAAEREYGRDLARLGNNLGYRETEYRLETERLMLEQQTANNQAAARRMVKPIMGYVEEAYVGPAPSSTEMVLGIGQSILSGVSAGMALAAPAGATGGPDVAGNLAKNPLGGGTISPGGAGGSIAGLPSYGKAGLGSGTNPLASLKDARIGDTSKYFKGFGK